MESLQISNWCQFADNYLSIDVNEGLKYLDESLNNRTYLVGNEITIADEKVYQTLMQHDTFLDLLAKEMLNQNIMRYIEFLKDSNIKVPLKQEIKKNNKEVKDVVNKKEKFEEGGKYFELKNAEQGKVVVRFPPEASGYLHIGHAKAALINYHYKKEYSGKLLLRFDDTNPDKDSGDFQKIILDDVERLGVKYDSLSYTSDYFELMMEYCEKLIKGGDAYADFTNPEEMKKQREKCEESKCRNHTIDENIRLWNEMKMGSEEGLKCCIRIKLDMKAKNGCMRDPTIYRCKTEPHLRTGQKFKVYPTYDFACPIVDSVEGVTNALRTSEYNDRNEQYYSIIDMLQIRKPTISDYSRLNLQNTVLSKRKLTWIVNEGYVDGWDDPRMPTVRGILRRGLTMEGLHQFIIAQGFGRNIATMSWDKIWAFNKKVIDPIVPRYTAVKASKDELISVLIEGHDKVETSEVAKHPKNEDVGKKVIYLSNRVLIEKVDAEQFVEGTNVTFINWGNMLVKSIEKDSSNSIKNIVCTKNVEDKNFKKTLKITWLPVCETKTFIPISTLYYDNIISKTVLDKDDDFKDFLNINSKREECLIGDIDLKDMKKGEIVQLQRKGYFICDREYCDKVNEYPLVLINIPEGKEVESSQNENQNKNSEKRGKNKENDKSDKKKNTTEKKSKNIHEKEEVKGIKKEKKKTEKKDKEKKVIDDKSNDNVLKKQTRTGLEVTKEDDFAEWYKQVLTKTEMLEYYNVSGCYIIREWGYFIWEEIVNYFNNKIREIGIYNSAFPMFVSEDCLKKEKEHIDDFSPEVAWVTKCGDKELDRPIAIRPTSETVMYPYFAKWIQSYTDLPFRLNQWCNVVRWEFKQPTPFIRSREFYWQEGHTAHETREGAVEEVYQILEFYASVYEDLMAVPVVRGKKTEKEKFAGADFTTTIEAYIETVGRAIQGATSHHLGQNFSKMFDVRYQSSTGSMELVHQNSWGLTTRTLGVLVMVHGDNKGLCLPPKLAKIQVVIVPVGLTVKTSEENKLKLLGSCNEMKKQLSNSGIRVYLDGNENNSPGWKFNHWELRGVPIRIELGPNELEKGTVTLCYRYNLTKETVSRDNLDKTIQEKFVEIHSAMLARARKSLETHRTICYTMSDLCSALDKKMLITAPFCGRKECEEKIKTISARSADVEEGAPSMGAKSLCIPFEQPDKLGNKCIQCDNKPLHFTMFGRSY